MGYSLSIALPTKRACDTLHAWLEANFRPYCTALKGWESDYTSLQRHPSYRPRPGKSFGSVTGFDYSCGGAERLYVWEVAKLISRLAGARLYYDYEVIEDACGCLIIRRRASLRLRLEKFRSKSQNPANTGYGTGHTLRLKPAGRRQNCAPGHKKVARQPARPGSIP